MNEAKKEQIKKKYEAKLQMEEQKLERELLSQSSKAGQTDEGMERELKKFEAELRKELESANQIRLGAERKQLEISLKQHKASIEAQQEQALNMKRKEI